MTLVGLRSAVKTRYASLQFRRYLRARKIYRHAPYSLAIYEQLLRRFKDSDRHQFIRFLEYGETRMRKDNIFVRHDIDTQNCITNLSQTLEIDQSLQIPSGIYFRVDDEEYCVRDFQKMIGHYKVMGFEIGLHTLCYTQDNYLQEFKRETEKFKSELGFSPMSFSVHGLGDFRLEVRMRFYKEIALSFREFGYETGDIPPLRSYEHMIHDCHLDADNRRFLYDEFVRLPPFYLPGKRYLILTHPCYWKA